MPTMHFRYKEVINSGSQIPYLPPEYRLQQLWKDPDDLMSWRWIDVPAVSHNEPDGPAPFAHTVFIATPRRGVEHGQETKEGEEKDR